MEAEPDEDDMFVVIVGDSNGVSLHDTPAPSRPLSVDNILNTAVKHGEYVDMAVKEEPPDEYVLEETITVKEENDNSEDDNMYMVEEYNEDGCFPEEPIKRRTKTSNKNVTSEYTSYVEAIREMYPETKTDTELLIEKIAEKMRNVQVPAPPKGFCIEDGVRRICKYCEAVTPTLAAAVRHYQEKHGPWYLSCYACGCKYRCTVNLYKHEKRCRAPDAIVVQKARHKFKGKKQKTTPFIQYYKKREKQFVFPCKECTAVFSSRDSLSSHENLHTGRRPYKCTQCTNAFTSRYAFHRHMKMHSGIEYICDICGKVFKIKSLLVSHMDTHGQIKRFICEYCDRRFRQKRALEHHVNKVHKNLPAPCACQLCDKRYSRMSLLKVHMDKAHGLVLMTRGMLIKALPTMSELQLQKAGRIVFKTELEEMEREKQCERIAMQLESM